MQQNHFCNKANPFGANRDLVCLQNAFRQLWSELGYEIIDDPLSYYAHVPGLEDVWATGRTFEECCKELISTIEGWIVLGLRLGHSILSIDGRTIDVSTEPVAVVQ